MVAPSWRSSDQERSRRCRYITTTCAVLALLFCFAFFTHANSAGARRIASGMLNKSDSPWQGKLSRPQLVSAYGCHKPIRGYEVESESDSIYYQRRTNSSILIFQYCTNPNSLVAFPLKTHSDYARKHSYDYVARRAPAINQNYSEEIENLDDYWTKVKLLDEIINSELLKPVGDRSEWIFFADSDTIVINQEVKIEDLLPPRGSDHVQMIVGRDGWGINAGVFLIRISEWSKAFVHEWLWSGSSVPGWLLPMREQTMLQMLQPKDEIVVIEKYWFNAWGKPNPFEANRDWGEAGPRTFHAHFNGEGKADMLGYEQYLAAPKIRTEWRDGARETKEELAKIWKDYYDRRHA